MSKEELMVEEHCMVRMQQQSSITVTSIVSYCFHPRRSVELIYYYGSQRIDGARCKERR